MQIEIDGKKADVLNINLEKGFIDFRWADAGEYSGVCMAPMDSAALEKDLKDFDKTVLAKVDKTAVKSSALSVEGKA